VGFGNLLPLFEPDTAILGGFGAPPVTFPHPSLVVWWSPSQATVGCSVCNAAVDSLVSNTKAELLGGGAFSSFFFAWQAAFCETPSSSIAQRLCPSAEPAN